MSGGLLLALWLGAAAAHAENPTLEAGVAAVNSESGFGAGSHERFAKRVNAAQSTDYKAVLAAYDAWRAGHPEDVTSQIEHCRFIETFAYLEEPTIESAGDDLEACRTQLKSGLHEYDAEVRLYIVESSWEPEALAQAQKLIPESAGWKRDQRTRLFELLAERNRWKNADLAASFAMRAVDLDPGSSVLMMAVNRWVQLGAKDKARKILLAAPSRTWEKASRTEAAQVLLDMGEAASATKLLRGAKDSDQDPRAKLALARALSADGEVMAARKLYLEALTQPYIALDTRIEYFEFERQHGSRQDALAAYDKLRGEGFAADSLARYRLGLFVSRPGIAWQWRDAWGVLALLGTTLAFCLLPLLFIVPVHYRGLALRASGRAPIHETTGWTLRDAWYAFGAFLLVGFASLYVFAMPYLDAILPWSVRNGVDPATDHVLAKVLLCSTVGSLALLLPLMRRRSVKATLCGRWSIRRSIFVGLGAAVLLKIVTALVGLGINSAGMLGSDTVRSIQGAYDAYGLLAMLLLISVVTPFVEELVFRGVMLEAFRGHVSFVFAALVQAAAFVLMHEEWQSMPFLFAFALVAAWLARRSEGLLAPMVMHSVNNLMAGLAIVGMTSVLNH
jgi:membrane protease YdiL (CAAX protease family)